MRVQSGPKKRGPLSEDRAAAHTHRDEEAWMDRAEHRYEFPSPVHMSKGGMQQLRSIFFFSLSPYFLKI